MTFRDRLYTRPAVARVDTTVYDLARPGDGKEHRNVGGLLGYGLSIAQTLVGSVVFLNVLLGHWLDLLSFLLAMRVTFHGRMLATQTITK